MKEKIAVKDLREIKHIFDKNDIEFWLDQGTLLGAIRDGRIIEWDSDIDLGTWFDNATKLISIFPEFKKRACNVVLNRKWAVMTIRKFDCNINVSLYHKRGNYAWKTWVLRKKLVERILGQFVNITSVRTCAEQEGMFAQKIMYVSSPLPSTLKQLMTNMAWLLLNKRGCMIPVVIPKHYFEKLSTTQFYGMQFNAPSNVEKYLKYRYGTNWKTPIKKWIYYKHDGTIKPNWNVLHFKV